MLDNTNTVLVVTDVQERLAPLMHEKDILFKNLQSMIKGAKTINVPILVTEQVPIKIGKTIPEISSLLEDCPRFEKIHFSCCKNQEFVRTISEYNKKNVLLTGIETHICIYQTALDLLRLGFLVHIVVDAVASRTALNKEIGLQRIKSAGGSWMTVEMVLMEILGKAQGEEFKEILKLIR